ncbi:hypothetical protein PHMEG_00010966 [Phytophthora megakarya]|uniref:Uncharacterized protein n=1 Tax=Phytophthora megakarya TaxID=4795 RepID=A0A225WDB4_9STRA|nr:hypothetical protein PHMEG_00010966 [Phytophthora megakarya]
MRNIPARAELRPVLGRSSFIDDITDLRPNVYQSGSAIISATILENLRESSDFGKRTISYPSHEIGVEWIRTKHKTTKGVKHLSFPSTLKGVQSFLGSLNNINNFLQNTSVVAAVLYDLTDEQIRPD